MNQQPVTKKFVGSDLKGQEEDILCTSCQDLDLAALFSGAYVPEETLLRRKSAQYSTWIWKRGELECRLCVLIEMVWGKNIDGWCPPRSILNYSPSRRELALAGLDGGIFFSREMGIGRRNAEDVPDRDAGNTILAIPPICPPLLEDVAMLKDMIKECQSTHPKCQIRDLHTGSIPTRLRLINCASRTVVAASANCQYAALSYTWGSHKRPQIGSGSLGILPQTIEDALIVTGWLNLPYLWVDAYCINQNDKDDMDHQIHQMDLIYSAAEVTIMAASGADPSSGLSGISRKRNRTWQYSTAVGEFVLGTFKTRGWKSVDDSTWNSRGWTFQEVLFSRRRLFFAEGHTVYNCKSRCVSEDLSEPLEDLAPPLWAKNPPEHIAYDLIESFSKRNLTYDKDVLNALAGVYRRLATLNPPVRHLRGLPVRHDHPNEFLVGLVWRFRDPDEHLDNTSRRLEFPTWSWAGWKCAVVWPSMQGNWRATDVNRGEDVDVDIQVEMQDGSLVSWAKAADRMVNAACNWEDESTCPRASHCLVLTALTIPISIAHSNSGVYANIQGVLLRVGTFHHKTRLKLDPTFGDPGGDNLLGVYLGLMFVLLVSKVAGHYERIGVMAITPDAIPTVDSSGPVDRYHTWKHCMKHFRRKTLRLG